MSLEDFIQNNFDDAFEVASDYVEKINKKFEDMNKSFVENYFSNPSKVLEKFRHYYNGKMYQCIPSCQYCCKRYIVYFSLKQIILLFRSILGKEIPEIKTKEVKFIRLVYLVMFYLKMGYKKDDIYSNVLSFKEYLNDPKKTLIKMFNKLCPFHTGIFCSVHDNPNRPDECKEYTCKWYKLGSEETKKEIAGLEQKLLKLIN